MLMLVGVFLIYCWLFKVVIIMVFRFLVEVLVVVFVVVRLGKVSR